MVEESILQDQEFILVLYHAKDQPIAAFATLFSQTVGFQTITIEVDRFADSETYITNEYAARLKNKRVLVLSQFFFTKSSSVNEQLMQALFVIDSIKKAGALFIEVFMPYLPYSRQDVQSKTDKKIGRIACVAKLLASAGVDRVVVSDLHQPAIITEMPLLLKTLPLTTLWQQELSQSILPAYKKQNVPLMIVSPDAGGLVRAQALAQALALPCVCLTKERYAPDQSRVLKASESVRGAVVILVDDIVDTARTACNAALFLKQQGAVSIIGCFSHAILSENANAALKAAPFEKLFVADTIASIQQEIKNYPSLTLVSSASFLGKLLKDDMLTKKESTL